MGRCKLCSASSSLISVEMGVCLRCIRERPREALPIAMQAHKRSRRANGLPEEPPRDAQGIACNLCVNECRIPDGGLGYCGLRRNDGGKLTGVSSEEGKLSWYHDALPTNCVADWVCPGCTGAGYPRYALSPGPERGYKNLAVFFQACGFNCLYCQNWHFKRETFRQQTTPVKRLVSDIDERTSCICYFGGDPSPQLPFALKASRLGLEEAERRTKGTKGTKGRTLRICWETNGSMNALLLDEMLELSLKSGGCIKFDLKAWDDNLHKALTGITNKRTLENFARAGEWTRRRSDPPLVIANTLIVPGYVDEEEVRSIARFIASISPEIPYSLLAFYPHFYMSDMPLTSKAQAKRCLDIALEEGLKNVRLGNVQLLV
ncbi:MAG TPA: radical SAM protein [Methanotrichaceae archaeon]|nr:radical SAM protein [Methanotrichaceae archaeon]